MKSKNRSVATKSAKISPTLLSRARRGSVVSVPGNGQGDVVVMRRDHWDKVTQDLKTLRARVADLSLLIETYEVLNDPQMMDKIRRSMKDVAADRGVTIQEAKKCAGSRMSVVKITRRCLEEDLPGLPKPVQIDFFSTNNSPRFVSLYQYFSLFAR